MTENQKIYNFKTYLNKYYDSSQITNILKKLEENKILFISENKSSYKYSLDYNLDELFSGNSNSIQDVKLSDLNFSIRTYNCLYRTNVKSLLQLSEMTYTDLVKISGMGSKSIKEIIVKLNEFGLTLNGGTIYDLDDYEEEDCEEEAGGRYTRSTRNNPVNKPINILDRRINYLNLSVRTLNCLCKNDIYTIGELVKKTPMDILSIPKLGRSSYKEILLALEKNGLTLKNDNDLDASKDENVGDSCENNTSINEEVVNNYESNKSIDEEAVENSKNDTSEDEETESIDYKENSEQTQNLEITTPKVTDNNNESSILINEIVKEKKISETLFTLGLSQTIIDKLSILNITTIDDLASHTYSEIYYIDNMSAIEMDQIIEFLESKNLEFKEEKPQYVSNPIEGYKYYVTTDYIKEEKEGSIDSSVGKNVIDSQPNKYYDNPNEKSLEENYGIIFGKTEFDDEINAMFGYTGEKKAEKQEEKYSKPSLKMSQKELESKPNELKEDTEENEELDEYMSFYKSLRK